MGVMKTPHEINRRHFVQLSTLAAGAALLPMRAAATTMAEIRPVEKLPELGYAYAALEPHIDARTMEIHHTKHHAAYIEKYNAAMGSVQKRGSLTIELLQQTLPAIEDVAVRTTLRNNGGGHWNHTFFWKSMIAPSQSGAPSDALGQALQAAFGSIDDFKKAFGQAAATRFGSGWAWLIVKDGKLKVTSTANQDNPLMKGTLADADLGVPVLGLDVWEHAYYLHYQNRRADYIAGWWNVVNWAEVSKRFAEASA